MIAQVIDAAGALYLDKLLFNRRTEPRRAAAEVIRLPAT